MLTGQHSLIRTHAALPFTAHASPPTVTMPRVKALTTGSVPSFLDLLLNFAESDTSSSLAGQDTWLAQLRRRPSGTLAFFGDDTWLKLFPSWAGEGESGGDSSGAAVSEGDPPPPFFERADGTSSFFVSVSPNWPWFVVDFRHCTCARTHSYSYYLLEERTRSNTNAFFLSIFSLLSRS